ncbi:hypothetical protein GCM10010359_55610 [Streptomyces morookaense]|nr:hypothetical protein GCM10010359_55610 [Streptomyces morookaense]
MRAGVRLADLPREESRPYVKCPACGLIGEPGSVECHLTADRRHVDWAEPMKVSCSSCYTYSLITRSDIVDRDGEHTCSRCGDRTACPAGADRVSCWGCGLFAPGPASTGARAAYRHDVEQAAAQWAAARIRAAKDDARARGALRPTGPPDPPSTPRPRRRRSRPAGRACFRGPR